MDLLDSLRDALGGGTLSFWMLLGGLLGIWLAVKAVKAAIKFAFFVGALFLLVGVAPWSGAPVAGPTADCAAQAVEEVNEGVPAFLTKRVTVEALSDGAACAGEVGLSSGRAEVTLRTWGDVPFRTYVVTPSGASAQ